MSDTCLMDLSSTGGRWADGRGRWIAIVGEPLDPSVRPNERVRPATSTFAHHMAPRSPVRPSARTFTTAVSSAKHGSFRNVPSVPPHRPPASWIRWTYTVRVFTICTNALQLPDGDGCRRPAGRPAVMFDFTREMARSVVTGVKGGSVLFGSLHFARQ